MHTCTNTSEPSSIDSSTSDNQTLNENINFGQCCAMCYYSICFSTIIACSYWKEQTLNAIAEHAMLAYKDALNDGKEFTCNYLPQIVDICGAAVDVVFGSRYQGTLSCTSVSSKHNLEMLILENTSGNTGSLLLLSNYYLACIFLHANNSQQKTKYFLVACNERQTINLFEKITDFDSVIDKICIVVTQKLECDEIEYDIQFLSCSCQLTKLERQKMVRKYKSSAQKRLIANKSKENNLIWYSNLEPAKKKKKSEKAVSNYKKIMDPIRKKDRAEENAKKYKSMDPIKKEGSG